MRDVVRELAMLVLFAIEYACAWVIVKIGGDRNA